MNNFSAQQLILSNYIKYDILKGICGSVFGGVNPDDLKSVNIYIDLYSVLYSLYAGSYEPALDKGEWDIAAGIINMISHYRTFFRGYNIETKFFFVYSNNYSVDKTKLVPEYNSDMEYRMNYSCSAIHNSILENIQLVDQIAKYVNDVTFISSNTADVSVLMYHVYWMNNFDNNKDFNIIISKDHVVYQLLALMPKTIVFRPKKYKGVDSSFFISSIGNGLLQSFIDHSNCKLQYDGNISNALYSFILAATKVPQRGLPSLVGVTQLIKELNKVIELPDVLNGYHQNPLDLCERFPMKINTKLQHGNIIGRFKAIDAVQGYAEYSNSPERLLYKGMQNLYDPNGLHEIDTKYFSEWHLNLENM